MGISIEEMAEDAKNQVRLVANGSVAGGTKVFIQDGVPLKRLKSVRWQHEAGKIPVLTLEIDIVGADVCGDAKFVANDPYTGDKKQVKRIEFVDGSVFEPPAGLEL